MEHFQLAVNDHVLSAELRKPGSDFIDFVHHHMMARDFFPLIAAGKLSRDFLRFYEWQGHLHNTLFRGASHHGYKLIQQHGNDKTLENSSPEEIRKLRQLGLRPQDIIYAAPHLSKAWEFIISRQEKPAILLAYDSNKLEMVNDDFYMYKLKQGYRSFVQALEAVVFVYFA